MKMKLLVLFFLISAVSYSRSSDVMDILMDTWLDHAREMMNSTKNQDSSSKGIQFMTECGAFITWENCTVTADMGIIKDLSSLKRHSSVSLSDTNDGKATVKVDLAYDNLGMFYPNMMISGRGVKIEYKGIEIKPSQILPFTLNMVLDYSKGVNACSNAFTLTPPKVLPTFSATVASPKKGNLPIEDLQNLTKEFLDEVNDHIVTLINYEKVCQRLVNLF